MTMGVLILRFDFRLGEDAPTTRSDLFDAALDMTEWAEQRDAYMVIFNEHHGSPDGYLPSPLIMATAAATRTSRVPISVAALLLLMYDPVKLAEDMITLDHLSKGRVGYTIGLGYRPSEYEMFGVDRSTRGHEIEERIEVLKRALAGERFEWNGRTIKVTPEPFTPGGPVLAYGGGSPAAARRAARQGMMLMAATADESLADTYDAEAIRVGTQPGMAIVPGPGPTSVFVAEDVDAGWSAYGEYMLHDARMYADWMGAENRAANYSAAETVDELRAEQGSYQVLDPDGAVDLIRTRGVLSLQPLCGGLPPDLAWHSLRLVEHEVLPRV
ncbi:MAG: LLM class flavin-dependent oxidoreductase [Actinomycetota bacterium]